MGDLDLGGAIGFFCAGVARAGRASGVAVAAGVLVGVRVGVGLGVDVFGERAGDRAPHKGFSLAIVTSFLQRRALCWGKRLEILIPIPL